MTDAAAKAAYEEFYAIAGLKWANADKATQDKWQVVIERAAAQAGGISMDGVDAYRAASKQRLEGFTVGFAVGIEAAAKVAGDFIYDNKVPLSGGLVASIRALSPPASAGTVKHTDRSVPCPTCGFVIRQVERRPLVIQDDNPPLSASAPAGAQPSEEDVCAVLEEIEYLAGRTGPADPTMACREIQRKAKSLLALLRGSRDER